jgi:hypothetical protein
MWYIRKRLAALRTGRGVYRLCTKVGFSIRASRVATKVCRSILGWPVILQRRLLARNFVRSNPPGLDVDKSAGCGFFLAADLPWGQKVVDRSWEIWESRKAQGQAEGGEDGKHYRSDLLDAGELKKYPEFLAFATSKELVSSVVGYLGTFPVLASIRLWYTETNESTQSAQLFHIDQEDFHQFKVFVNINDVSSDNGPLTIVNAQASRRIYKELKDPFHRVSDGDILKRCNSSDVVELVGPAGTAGYVDTSACFHMGSRTRSGGRLVLMISFLAYPVIRETDSTIFERSLIPWEALPAYTPQLLSRQ